MALNSSSAIGVRRFGDLGERFGEILAVLSHAGFVEHLAQTVEVGLRRVRSFGRDEAFRAHVGARLRHLDDQADVGQLGHAAHEDDVRRLDVAVDQASAVQVGEAEIEREAEFETFAERQATALEQDFGESLGDVGVRVEASFGGPRYHEALASSR